MVADHFLRERGVVRPGVVAVGHARTFERRAEALAVDSLAGDELSRLDL